MITKFGIKEAVAAGKFAKTKEQKLTVLATMAMLGIKNGIGKAIDKQRNKATTKLMASLTKAQKLRKKLTQQVTKDTVQTDNLSDLNDVQNNWVL